MLSFWLTLSSLTYLRFDIYLYLPMMIGNLMVNSDLLILVCLGLASVCTLSRILGIKSMDVIKIIVGSLLLLSL